MGHDRTFSDEECVGSSLWVEMRQPFCLCQDICPALPSSLYSPFLLAVPYKAGIVGDMNATIQQNEINNAQRQDQR